MDETGPGLGAFDGATLGDVDGTSLHVEQHHVFKTSYWSQYIFKSAHDLHSVVISERSCDPYLTRP